MTTYGESRSDAMDATISDCLVGMELLVEDVQAELGRRKSGQSTITTSRGGPNAVIVNPGMRDGYTTDTLTGIVVQNKDARLGKYEPYVAVPRPSHGDFTYSTKFDMRNQGGDEYSSVRETASWVATGTMAKQIIEWNDHDIEIKAHVNQIGDMGIPEVSLDEMREHTEENDVHYTHPETTAEMQELTEGYQKEGDSIGGSIYFEVQGAPRGLGTSWFDPSSARLGQALMSVPVVTAFRFGLGHETREWTGHGRNENWEFDEEDDPRLVGSNHGGIQGGITTGEPIYGELTLHVPMPIPKKQRTINREAGEGKGIQVVGRHDLVFPPRDVPIIETMLYVTVPDFMLLDGRISPDRLDGRASEYDTPYHLSSPDSEQRARFRVIVHSIPRT